MTADKLIDGAQQMAPQIVDISNKLGSTMSDIASSTIHYATQGAQFVYYVYRAQVFAEGITYLMSAFGMMGITALLVRFIMKRWDVKEDATSVAIALIAVLILIVSEGFLFRMGALMTYNPDYYVISQALSVIK